VSISDNGVSPVSAPSPARAKAAIVGVSDAVSPTGELAGTVRSIQADVVAEALDDAGLKASDVDAVATCTGGAIMFPSMELADYLGIRPRWTDSTNIGGSSLETYVEHVSHAIALGVCETALIVYAETPRSNIKRAAGQRVTGAASQAAMAQSGTVAPRLEWESSFGMLSPIGGYALAASRHMAMYGTTSEQLAQIAVSTREWAALNPKARYRDPLTIDDVVNSPMQASPLHKLDCCLVTDGAGAVVVTSAERARDLRKPPAYVLGAASGHTHSMISQMPDLTVTAGADTGKRAFAMAGISPSDVDVLQTYDSFTITVLLALEDLGFCAKGEGGPFVADGKLGPGGAFPAQTSGGGLSYTHPGMFGMFLLVEAVRQLRGEGEARQVPDVNVAVAHGVGGVLSSASTIVLGSEATL
jgi:acetyl-CoA acetyltransferase